MWNNYQWATLEDFATLFQYLWHRDFPVDRISTGANRSDWRIHTGIVVRGIADLMGLAARYERGGKKDALLRSTDGDEIAVEWEWQGNDIYGANKELYKLKTHQAWSTNKNKIKSLRYAVLITYGQNISEICTKVAEEWRNAMYPLLLILVKTEESTAFSVGQKFDCLHFYVFNRGEYSEKRCCPASPWEVIGTRWFGINNKGNDFT